MRVLIIGAEARSALAATRSLGKKGFCVVAGSPYRPAQSFYSKYCSERLIYPNPQNEGEFVRFMLRYVKDNRIDVMLPVAHLATTRLSKYRDEFCQYTKLPVAKWASMDIACNKDKTLKLAEDLGIRTPRSYRNPEEIEGYPIVVKGVVGTGSTRYIGSSEALSKIRTSGLIVQEYIHGEGYGFEALFNEGKVRATFMHRRIREYPVTGGPSSAAESICDSKLRDLGLQLLETLHWHGVAMVEFRKDSRDGEFKLMEINPRFWGSLDLAINCGVDFPYLAVKMAAEGDVEPVSSYDVGARFRWPFPDDILHLLANPSSASAILRDIFDRDTKSNIWLRDLGPNLFQILLTLRTIATRIRNSNLRNPDGIPGETP